VYWSADGWPRIRGGVPAETVPAPADGVPTFMGEAHAQPLGVHWSTLRRPATPDWVDLTSRPSHLRIHGGQSPMGRHAPSLVARRVTAQGCRLETALEFTPRSYRQLAGIAAYYNTRNWYLLCSTADDDGTPVLNLVRCDSGTISVVPEVSADLTGVDRLGLRVTFDGPSLAFAFTTADAKWQDAGPVYDATTLSDEYAATVAPGEPPVWGFTGAFAGLWVQDLGAEGGYADFEHARFTTW
jgi:xylan 1,4-beta-xylosidase